MDAEDVSRRSARLCHHCLGLFLAGWSVPLIDVLNFNNGSARLSLQGQTTLCNEIRKREFKIHTIQRYEAHLMLQREMVDNASNRRFHKER